MSLSVKHYKKRNRSRLVCINVDPMIMVIPGSPYDMVDISPCHHVAKMVATRMTSSLILFNFNEDKVLVILM